MSCEQLVCGIDTVESNTFFNGDLSF